MANQQEHEQGALHQRMREGEQDVQGVEREEMNRIEIMTALISPEAAYSRLVQEGPNSQTFNQARQAGLGKKDVEEAVSLWRAGEEA
jgi:hypothetical protein